MVRELAAAVLLLDSVGAIAAAGTFALLFHRFGRLSFGYWGVSWFAGGLRDVIVARAMVSAADPGGWSPLLTWTIALGFWYVKLVTLAAAVPAFKREGPLPLGRLAWIIVGAFAAAAVVVAGSGSLDPSRQYLLRLTPAGVAGLVFSVASAVVINRHGRARGVGRPLLVGVFVAYGLSELRDGLPPVIRAAAVSVPDIALLSIGDFFIHAGVAVGAIALLLDEERERRVEERRDAAERLRAHEEQLQRAQRLEAIGRLAGGIAHDFNNLLTAIRGHAEMLQDELPANDAREVHVRNILSGAERAARLTRQLLAFGRKQVLAPRLVDLRDLVTGLEPMMRSVLRENIALAIDLPPSPVLVRVDCAQMEQAIMNLVLNARDAMPGRGMVRIEARLSDAPDRPALERLDAPEQEYVTLRVRDTGTGMDPETLAHAFEPFFTTKDASRGSGLGLPSVYGIVRQSGGIIDVQTAPGAGTTFSIYLPSAASA